MATSPEIHIALDVSFTTLSKSGRVPFSLVLTATLHASRPITVLNFMTLLSTTQKALYEGGFTFTDAETGILAPRRTIDLCYDSGDDGGILLAPKNASLFLELQPDVPCRIEHVFKLVPSAPDSATVTQIMDAQESDASGLEPGRRYRVGLGGEQSSVSWWKYGPKDEVLGAEGRPVARELVEDTHPQALPLILDKAATFLVEE